MSILDAIPYAIAAALALGGGGYVLHCQQVKKGHERFIAQLTAEAAEQALRNEEIIRRNKREKEDADADAQDKLARLNRDLQRLRNERTRTSSVPAAPAATQRPDLACFDRAELGRALGNLEAGVEGLIAEGATLAVELDVARRWAARQVP